MWLNKHYWSGSQTNQMNHSKRFFFWFVFLSAFDCPLFFLAKTFTQAHYWQPSIRLPLLDKWWNVVWFQAIPLSRICQCELHQKAPHKKKNREVCSLVLRIFARTNLSCGEILACLFHLRWVLGNTLWGGKMLLLPLRDIKWQWLPATCWASHSLGASLLAHPPQFCAKSSRFSGDGIYLCLHHESLMSEMMFLLFVCLYNPKIVILLGLKTTATLLADWRTSLCHA